MHETNQLGNINSLKIIEKKQTHSHTHTWVKQKQKFQQPRVKQTAFVPKSDNLEEA
jgi:hypothetical protein